MTLRSFLTIVGIMFAVMFGLYIFGFIRPNKENLPFVVDKNIETKTKTTNTPSTPPTTPGK